MFEKIRRIFGSSPGVSAHLPNDPVFIDVRTAAEFKTGHIAGAQNIPLDELYQKTDEIKKLNKPVITVCRSGARSAVARGILSSAGIDAHDGGAWTNFKKT